MRVIRKYPALLAACWLLAWALPGFASTEWLITQQQASGAITAPLDAATPVQSTAEAIRTLHLLDRAASTVTAQNFLASEAYHGTEYLARKIIAGAEAAIPVDSLVAELLTHQNADGGFGELVGFQSTALDTGFALEALAASVNLNHASIGYVAGYLLQTQKSDGGWAHHGASSDAYVTAIVARALYALRDRFAAVPAAATNAGGFLVSRRAPDGLWGEDLRSAQALLTLSTTVNDVVPLQQSADALRARRLADTSWSSDVYATSLALRALHIFDARRGGATIPPSGGSVAGYVLRSGSPEPLEGAVISIGSQIQTQTNSEGYFVLAGAPAGDQTVTISKSGYLSASRAVTVRDGQFSSTGTVFLAQSSTDVLVRGRVFDAHDGRPLASVSISLSGSANQTVSSNAEGEFELSGLPAGTYAVMFRLAGYYDVSGVAPGAGRLRDDSATSAHA